MNFAEWIVDSFAENSLWSSAIFLNKPKVVGNSSQCPSKQSRISDFAELLLAARYWGQSCWMKLQMKNNLLQYLSHIISTKNSQNWDPHFLVAKLTPHPPTNKKKKTWKTCPQNPRGNFHQHRGTAVVPHQRPWHLERSLGCPEPGWGSSTPKISGKQKTRLMFLGIFCPCYRAKIPQKYLSRSCTMPTSWDRKSFPRSTRNPSDIPLCIILKDYPYQTWQPSLEVSPWWIPPSPTARFPLRWQ